MTRMTRWETIIGVTTIAVVIGGGLIAYGFFEGRLASIERDHRAVKEQMQKAGQGIIDQTKDHILNLYDKECHWLDYMPRYELTNIQHCPEGFYMKGLGFHHKMHENYTYQMSYRLRCCALTALPPEE